MRDTGGALLTLREPASLGPAPSRSRQRNALQPEVVPTAPGLAGSKPRVHPRRIRGTGGGGREISALPAQGTIVDHASALWRVLDELGILQRLARRPVEKAQPQARQLSLFGAGEPEAQSFEAPWVEVGSAEGSMALELVREMFRTRWWGSTSVVAQSPSPSLRRCCARPSRQQRRRPCRPWPGKSPWLRSRLCWAAGSAMCSSRGWPATGRRSPRDSFLPESLGARPSSSRSVRPSCLVQAPWPRVTGSESAWPWRRACPASGCGPRAHAASRAACWSPPGFLAEIGSCAAGGIECTRFVPGRRRAMRPSRARSCAPP